ncbi:uncharacterized protein PHACADRAFT_207578 [Phanerochaete carnosa HHB-10118-sp]|uniref:Uncharacterized protein n=1 Tax=Phanerochaete carnosa (strain HHB-10118-sp) TaxID=650164 RepID=K5WAU2_PHACS|nr:uncharacterized protein PHACADRAFT_207578 [Phanerochaete carnosa HHB-10118-sp]EKM56300.1 hypothetical protein PHACADRAFT_207578 [Phanerochaete carnosa HHB-10118-sp]
MSSAFLDVDVKIPKDEGSVDAGPRIHGRESPSNTIPIAPSSSHPSGCPYKPAVDECVLSLLLLHSLNILRLFISVTKWRCSFKHPPNEVLDAIVGPVYRNPDMLALALS